jgi:hypothetical protein
MTSILSDDWDEELNVQDLVETIKNRERELKLLEDRKKMEEDDLVLTESLFNGENDSKIIDDKILVSEPIRFITDLNDSKIREIKIVKTKKQKELREREKEKKLRDNRKREIYGEASIDEYDEIYGSIADKYS